MLPSMQMCLAGNGNDQKHNFDLIKKVSKTYKLNIVNYYPVCYCKSTLVIALRIVADSSTKLTGVETDSVPFIYKKLVDFHKKNYEILTHLRNHSHGSLHQLMLHLL